MRTLRNAITPLLQRGSLSTSNLPRPTRRTLLLLVACVFFMYRTTRNNGLVYDTLKTLDQMFNQPRTQTQSTTSNSDKKVRDNVHNNSKITTGKVEKYSSIQYNQTEKQLLQTFSSLTLSFQETVPDELKIYMHLIRRKSFSVNWLLWGNSVRLEGWVGKL